MRDTKFHIRISQLKILKRRRIRKDYERKRNIARQNKRYYRILRSTSPGKRRFDLVQMPEMFSFDRDLEGLIKFTNKTFKKYKDYKFGHLFFNMNQVVELDMPAICLLLSLLNKFTWNNISYAGNVPNDQRSFETFIKSGFLEMMKSKSLKLKAPSIPNQLYIDGSGQRVPLVAHE